MVEALLGQGAPQQAVGVFGGQLQAVLGTAEGAVVATLDVKKLGPKRVVLRLPVVQAQGLAQGDVGLAQLPLATECLRQGKMGLGGVGRKLNGRRGSGLGFRKSRLLLQGVGQGQQSLPVGGVGGQSLPQSGGDGRPRATPAPQRSPAFALDSPATAARGPLSDRYA